LRKKWRKHGFVKKYIIWGHERHVKINFTSIQNIFIAVVFEYFWLS
jgi:hypothetical protein